MAQRRIARIEDFRDTSGDDLRTRAIGLHYVIGFAVQLRTHAEVASTLDIPGADPLHFPATTKTVASGALPMSIAEEFAYGLDLILGIDRLEDHQHSPRRSAAKR